MSASVRLDQQEFQRTFQKLASLSPSELSVFTNFTLRDIAIDAKERTPIADRGKILSDLGATMTSQKIVKGKTRRRYKYSPTPLVYAIINARRAAAGKPAIPRDEMATAAKKMIASRLRAVGSLRSGWSRAIGILIGAFGGSDGPRIRMTSNASPAKPGWSPTATLEYRETVDRGHGREVDGRVIAALEGAFATKQANMAKRIEDKLTGIAKRAGAIK